MSRPPCAPGCALLRRPPGSPPSVWRGGPLTGCACRHAARHEDRIRSGRRSGRGDRQWQFAPSLEGTQQNPAGSLACTCEIEGCQPAGGSPLSRVRAYAPGRLTAGAGSRRARSQRALDPKGYSVRAIDPEGRATRPEPEWRPRRARPTPRPARNSPAPPLPRIVRARWPGASVPGSGSGPSAAQASIRRR